MKKIILAVIMLVAVTTIGCVKAHLPNPETNQTTFRLCSRIAETVRGKPMHKVAEILGSPYNSVGVWNFYRYDAGQRITLYVRVNFIMPENKAHPWDGGFYCDTVEPLDF